ncbi:MAG: HD domain-containing protein [Oscillospiraceae bacterium]|jgi:HD-GYP domain-containing protein (c-di-GMP phosphodiesterase class II)|nr:HD domain-containing protein [Oscillospiraceae bacterium]
MSLRLDQLIRAIADALDIVESELLGATTNHGRRIAALCAVMARDFGLSETEISALATCALFHDSALSEAPAMPRHCELGQRNIELLPLGTDVSGYILYHHEHADGSGVFSKREGEYPLGAELIAIADISDVENRFQNTRDLDALLRRTERDPRFTKRAAYALCSVLSDELLEKLRDENIAATDELLIPAWNIQPDDAALMKIAELAAHIIDYKSEFTRRHTSQIANRSWLMGEFYDFSRAEKARLFLAAALHDLGKLAIPPEVLEKAGKLTDEEFITIKSHVSQTRKLLKGVEGLEEIREWAGNHHEKLNGKGYPRGLDASRLDFNSRLIACIDVYQAVSEARPYHGQRTHGETMAILQRMAADGGLDADIVSDMDTVMARYSMKEVPAPV